MALAGALLYGCSAGTAPIVSSISFPNGAASSLAPGATLAMSVTVTGDSKNLGVTWLATCTPPFSTKPVTSVTSATACGTFSPVQTPSGAITTYTAPDAIPTNGTVAITATSVTDPTRVAGMSLNIAGQPLTVTITPSIANVEVNGSASFTANVTNDPANAGVVWTMSCGTESGAFCGGFDATLTTQTIAAASGTPVLYYAPAVIPPSGVTLTATSVTNITVLAQAAVTIVPAITVNFYAPPPTTLAPGASASLTAVVANDSANGGVTWSVTCSGGGTGCGSLTPAQTASGAATVFYVPSGTAIGTTAVVTATSVTDTTKSVSATVTIASNISVAITSAVTVVSLGGSANFAATVINDPANAGVMWTATAGSFSPTLTSSGVATTYTAPASLPNTGTVTITATSVSDPTKSASTTILISAALTVSISPQNATVEIGHTVTFIATVTGDSANGGVTWSASAGSFSVSKTASGASTAYTAPKTAGSVTVTATSVTNSSVTATASITVSTQSQPISVSVSPTTASVATGATASFTAVVANDNANGGVTWSCMPAGSCGSFNPTSTASGVATTYTAPAEPGAETITATSVTDTTKSASAAVTITEPDYNALLTGPYIFALTGVAPGSSLSSGYESYLGSLTADGNGNITAGEVDFTSVAVSGKTANVQSLTGTYTISAAGQGSVTLKNTAKQFSLTLSVTMTQSGHGLAMTAVGSADGGVMSGTLDRQTTSSFATPLSGSFAFTYLSATSISDAGVGIGGVMTLANGTITRYLEDEVSNDAATTGQAYASSDAFGAPDASGRGTITPSRLGTSGVPFVYYLVDGTRFMMESTVDGGLVEGIQEPSTALPSLAGTWVFTQQGFPSGDAANWLDAGGVLTCGSNGQLTAGTLDVNNAGTFTTGAVTGTCALDSPADGRGTITISSGSSGGVSSFAVYPTAQNTLLLLDLDSGVSAAGTAYSQAAGVSASTFNGSYADILQSAAENQSNLDGILYADGTAALSGTVDVFSENLAQVASGSILSGNALTDTGSGRLTGDTETSITGDLKQVFYIAGADTILSLESDAHPGAGLLQLQTFPGAGSGPRPVAVAVSPATATITGGKARSFTATISNDATASGVTWSCAPVGSCGSFSKTTTAGNHPSVMWTAPAASGTVTITATSVASSASTATATVAVTGAVSVSISPTALTVQTGANQVFTATVSNDASSAGVKWSCSPAGACGSFSEATTSGDSPSVTWTAPGAAGSVTVIATSIASPSASASATVTVSAANSNSLLNGPWVFMMNGQTTSNVLPAAFETCAGSLTADGSGHITAGELDLSSAALSGQVGSLHVTGLTGTYQLNAAGSGQIVLNNKASHFTLTLSLSLASAAHGLVAAATSQVGEGGILSGTIDQQTAGLGASSIHGSYAFTFSQDDAASGDPDDRGGVLTIANGTITNYLLDENDSGTVYSGSYAGSDAFSAPDANGRGTITLSADFHHDGAAETYVYYLVDATHFVLESTEEGGIGAAYQAAASPNLSGSYAFTEAGFYNQGGNFAEDVGGVFTCNGSGSLTAGTLDVTFNGSFQSETGITGTCALDSPADGRGTMTVTAGSLGGLNNGVGAFALYPTANNGVLMLDIDTAAHSGYEDAAGVAWPQTSGVAAATFSGNYAAAFQSQVNTASTLLGTVTASGTAALTGELDEFDEASATNNTGVALTSENPLMDIGSGRLTGDIDTKPTGDLTQIFYIVSADTVLTLESDSSTGVGILQLQNLP